MKKILRNLVLIVTTAALTGCATMEQQDQAAGAIGGCVVGGIIGALVSGPRGAAVGCVAAGAVGWAVVSNYQAKQARTAASDAKKYRSRDPDFYAISNKPAGPNIKIRDAGVSPSRVKPGQEILISTDFSLNVPENQSTVPVEYSMTMIKDGKTLTSKKMPTESRGTGGWNYDTPFSIPQGAEPGVYTVKQRVSTGSNTYDEVTSKFTVVG